MMVWVPLEKLEDDIREWKAQAIEPVKIDMNSFDYGFYKGLHTAYERIIINADASPFSEEAEVSERKAGWLGKLRSRLSKDGA